uniref:TSA: Wollemia nobilis Ref_Wollemi_Transcript_8155_3912 transcribed RNA sequence n=1 Tax=Wollemia nobilis TaxID=56998 RepID=A0A0C9RNL1_9CONI
MSDLNRNRGGDERAKRSHDYRDSRVKRPSDYSHYDDDDNDREDRHRERDRDKHRYSSRDDKLQDRASHERHRDTRREKDESSRREKEGRKMAKDDADDYEDRHGRKGERYYEDDRGEKGGREKSAERSSRRFQDTVESYGRERSVEAADRVRRERSVDDVASGRGRRAHEGGRESRERSMDRVRRPGDGMERSVDDVASRTKRDGRDGSMDRSHGHRDKDSQSHRERAKRSHESRDSETLGGDRDGRSRKRREREHESEGRKDKGDKKRSFAEDDEDKGEKKDRGEKRKWDDRKHDDDDDSVNEKMSIKRHAVGGVFGESVQVADAQQSIAPPGNGNTVVNGVQQAPTTVPSKESSKDSPKPLANSELSTDTKVSTVFTTNVVENKADNIARSHEVIGKTSTDGTASTAGKGGSLSLGALAKAKKALQIQKELSEKLKKLPQLNKPAGTSSTATSSAAPAQAVVPASLKTAVSASSSTPSAVAASATVQSKVPVSAGMPASTLPATGNVKITPAMTGVAGLMPGHVNIPNYEAVKRAQELAARMGFHQDPESMSFLNMFPGQVSDEFGTAGQPKPAKAPVLRLDAQGREIDEHGNVIDKPKITSLSTLKVNINKQKKEAFQILKPELDEDAATNPHFDPRMGIDKTKIIRPKRMTFQFVEEGKWSKEAEILKFKSQFGEAQAKELKIKHAQLAKAKAELDINPNLIEVSERVFTKEEKPKDPIPDVEWWDLVLLPSGSYVDVTEGELKVKMEKLTIYVEHPQPIEPPAEPLPPPPQPLKLTKKEQKKLRTQRRLAKEKDRQEMIRQGLIEPPKPKVKMSNLMKVLGAEATQDPTKLEMEIRSAAAEREQAHVDRNIARKLTPAERREKKEKKLFEDPNTLETIVSVYKINDLSHPQTRFKVDINAQENRLSGCAVITDSMSVVVVEGGSKSIKRYGKLMLRRINWAAAVVKEEDEDEDDDRPVNKCQLVWQGSVAKPSFHRFVIQQCRTEAAARKFFADVSVAHYWDLAVNFSEDQIS